MEGRAESRSESVAAKKKRRFKLPKLSWAVTRNQFYLSLMGCLLLPIVIVASYAASLGAEHGMFFVALIALVVGSLSGWSLLRLWERRMQRSVRELVRCRMAKIEAESGHQSQIRKYQDQIGQLKRQIHDIRTGYEHQIDLLHSSVAKSKDEVHHLHGEMDSKLEQMRVAYLEFEDLRKEYHRLEEEFGEAKKEAQKTLEHKDSLLGEYQRTISEQRHILEKKQGYIGKLETKVRDLMYEIRSLLQLEAPAAEASLPVDLSAKAMNDYYLPKRHGGGKNPPYDLSVQVEKYVKQAEGLLGAAHLGGSSPRFIDASFDSYAIDRRRLYDTFREETAGIIFIYSQVDKKFLFVNNHVKTVLGWSGEKFIKEFPRLVTMGFPQWKEALSRVFSMKESHVKIAIQSKGGKQFSFDCGMRIVTKGPFANHVVGVLALTE